MNFSPSMSQCLKNYALSHAQRRPERERHANAPTLAAIVAEDITAAIAPAQQRQKVKLAGLKGIDAGSLSKWTHLRVSTDDVLCASEMRMLK